MEERCFWEKKRKGTNLPNIPTFCHFAGPIKEDERQNGNQSGMETFKKKKMNEKENLFLINHKIGSLSKTLPYGCTIQQLNIVKNLKNISEKPQKVADITGSIAYERFTVNQIRKIFKKRENDFKEMERISLISSFLASLFIGRYSPIDLGDASGSHSNINLIKKGTNGLDIKKGDWDMKIISFAAQNLRSIFLDLPLHLII